MQMGKDERERLLEWAVYMIDRCLAKAEMLQAEANQMMAQAESYLRLSGRLTEDDDATSDVLKELQERVADLQNEEDDTDDEDVYL
jgi:gas vesicle protein